MNPDTDPQVAELLSQVRDLHTPPVSWVPALSWWLLALGVCAAVLAGAWWRRRYRRRRWQREARAELQRLRTQIGSSEPGELLAGCSALARRVMLVAEPRTRVASLQGEPWLQRLDAQVGAPVFSTGFGRLLIDGPYQRNPAVGPADLNELLDALERLVGAVCPRTTTGEARS